MYVKGKICFNFYFTFEKELNWLNLKCLFISRHEFVILNCLLLIAYHINLNYNFLRTILSLFLAIFTRVKNHFKKKYHVKKTGQAI